MKNFFSLTRFCLILFFIIPLDIVLIKDGCPIFGYLLILAQVPYILYFIKDKIYKFQHNYCIFSRLNPVSCKIQPSHQKTEWGGL